MHHQNVKKTKILYPGQKAEGARSKELISSSEDLFESSEYDEMDHCRESVASEITSPLLKRMNTVHQFAAKRKWKKRVKKRASRVKTEALLIGRTMKTFFTGLYEFCLVSGTTVQLEIFCLMFFPYMTFAIQKACEQGNLFYPINSKIMEYAHYHLIIEIVSLPIFVVTGVILIYYTPKFLQLIS